MDIFFTDPDDVPVPPDEVKIRELEAAPYADGRRVAVRFHVTPFLQKPNVEIDIYNARQENVASLSMVEIINNRMDFTMHLRQAVPGTRHTVKMRLFYSDLEQFELGERQSVSAETIFQEIEQTDVDRAECSFDLPD